MEKPFKVFANTRIGYGMQQALEGVLEKAQGHILIFMSRKGYWLYRMYKESLTLDVGLCNNVTIYSDRYIYKEDIPPEVLSDKEIYIFDDTVTTGVSLFKVYSILCKKYSNTKVNPFAAYILPEKRELQLNMRRLLPEIEESSINKFFSLLNTHMHASPGEVGWLSSQQIYVFQKQLVPYVIDLPFLKADDNKKTLTVSKETFMALTLQGSKWHYVNNSYESSNCMQISGKNGQRVMIKSGYFICEDDHLEKVFRENSLQLVIKCRYEEYDKDNFEVNFTPFAVMGSMRFDEAWEIFQILYNDIAVEYVEEKKKKKEQCEAQSNSCPDSLEGNIVEYSQLGTAVYRAIVYAFSMYAKVLFSKYLYGFVDKKIRLDSEIMKENSSELFINAVEKMDTWEEEEFQNRFDRMRSISKIGIQEKFNVCNFYNIGNDAEGLYAQVHYEVLRRKTQNLNDAFISIEEIQNYVSDILKTFDVKKQINGYLNIILRMLDQSILGNCLIIKNQVIYRGFRFGENSDVMIPYFNKYLLNAAIKLFYRCQWLHYEQKGEIGELFFKNIPPLFRRIRQKAEKRGYLNILISNEEFEWNEQYFADSKRPLNLLIENKLLINCDERDEIIDQNIDECLEELFEN